MQNDLLIRFIYEIVNQHSHIEQRFATPWDRAALRLAIVMELLRGNARGCVSCEFVKLRGT